MKVTDFTRTALAVRREKRAMLAAGWELVHEGGGNLWELERGGRWRHRITEVRIAHNGKALWVKVEKA